jgi:hypothetical protein
MMSVLTVQSYLHSNGRLAEQLGSLGEVTIVKAIDDPLSLEPDYEPCPSVEGSKPTTCYFYPVMV